MFALSTYAGLLFCVVVPSEVTFEKIVLTDRYYCDGITAGDINSDGHADIVAGPFWYEGPEFRTAHEIYDPVVLPREPSPSNSMFSFVYDFNGDGRPDVLVLGRVHKHEAAWYENPGPTDELWKRHFVFERVRGESPTLIDINSDNVPELICHWEGRWGWIAPNARDPNLPWQFTAIGDNEDWPEFYHGQGVGDINGDGRLDMILNDGWYEQPAGSTPDAASPQWTFHRHRFSADRGGAQMFALDVDADSDADVISAVNAHGWGLAWYEQSTVDQNSSFSEHLIMGDHSREAELGAAFTQPHALAMADIDGDGLADIVTGKRMWAHGPTGDIEPNAAPVVYWFRQTRTSDGTPRFVPQQIDDHSGVGVQITAADVNNDGRTDVLTASKLGSFVFLNRP
ncbi:MAG: VCBS repeat-containing protein [Planctomycetaceae bacterium]